MTGPSIILGSPWILTLLLLPSVYRRPAIGDPVVARGWLHTGNEDVGLGVTLVTSLLPPDLGIRGGGVMGHLGGPLR
jgi:hypothetical protein